MKKLILTIALLLIASNSFSQVHVRGYEKKDGTYVEPYYRSEPDGVKENNWSAPGNVNPYTGFSGGHSDNNSTYELPHGEINLDNGALRANGG